MGILLRWDITNTCKLNCIHCYNSIFRHGNVDELTIADVKTIVRRLPIDNISYVKLMGGEPFDTDLLYTICYELDNKKIPFGITTNGIFDINKYEEIFEKKMLKYITFSLDGYDEKDIHLFRKGLEINRVISNIKSIKALYPEILLCLNIILNKCNYKKMYNILDFYFSIGMNKVNITDLEGINDFIKHYKCNLQEMCIASKLIDDYVSEHKSCLVECSYSCCDLYNMIQRENLYISFDYRCRAGREIGYIDTKGNLFPCEAIQNNEKLYKKLSSDTDYSLLINDFFTIWMKEEFNNVYNYDVKFRFGNCIDNKKCERCSYRQEKCGKCYYRNSF